MEETRRNRVRRGAIFVATVFGIMSFVGVAPTGAAESSSIFSGLKPFQPINIGSAALNGVPTSSANGNGFLDSIEFTTINNPKWLTFGGVAYDLAVGDSVYIDDFEGRYRVSDGNIKFDGTALAWDICNRDTDADGLENCDERRVYGTDPLNPDTDGDDLGDGAEVFDHGTNPTLYDTDEDGLGDGLEVLTFFTDPLDADTDDGGVNDGTEVARGTNPLDGTDDFYAQVWTEDAPAGARNAPIDVASVLVDDEPMLPGEDANGNLGNLRFDAAGDQWVSINGTDRKVFSGQFVHIVDFRGAISAAASGDSRTVRVDGIAKVVLISEEMEGEAMHTVIQLLTSDDGSMATQSMRGPSAALPTLLYTRYTEVGGVIVEPRTTTSLPWTSASEAQFAATFDIWQFVPDSKIAAKLESMNICKICFTINPAYRLRAISYAYTIDDIYGVTYTQDETGQTISACVDTENPTGGFVSPKSTGL